MKRYSTNLTDKQWQVVEKILNRQERKRKYTLRDIMNAIFYTLKSGCQWCMLPKDFAPWQSVYFYFSKWKNEGIIEELLDTLRSYVCKMIGRNESPSLGIIDSRSVKSSHHVDADRGLDDNKKIKGRKQHIVVDTHGFPIAIAIHQANSHDSKGAPMVIDSLAYKFPRLVKILADGGYRDSLADWLMEKYGWDLEVVLKPDQCPSKFQVLPKRWIVERSFAWLENYRRLTIDYEFLAETSLAMVQLAFYKIFLNKIID
ncbi:MAG: IS5 family transposase [Bacteroides sp.]|jgi:putative transposase|nr:IS5 family transposase [Bacteroides sp.]